MSMGQDPSTNLALHDDLLDLGVGRTDEELGAVEAHAPQDLHTLGQIPRVEHGFGEVQVAEMARALGHVPRARLAAGGPVDNALPGVHEAPELGSAALIGLGEADAALGDGGAADLLGGEDAELDALDGLDGRLGVARRDGRHPGGLGPDWGLVGS